eukprot:TRINITY_DN13128_c0_g1_i1.p1 TRINITY_DN13128_c0_g1~~TRINITY_DN13128_c0_g1_i1.p1  ORF type:complete len:328 (-),score=108.71 TRINITY_DN13128_c0_g1_i1:75-965(-)
MNFLRETEDSVLDTEIKESRGERRLDYEDIKELQENEREEADVFAYRPDVDDDDGVVAPPPMRNYGNTGPKGVLKDYEEAKERAKVRMQKKNEKAFQSIEKHAMVIKTDAELKKAEEREAAAAKKSANDYEEEEEENWDEDDEVFFQQYYQKKMQEMQQLKKANPVFGKVVEVTKGTYVKTVENQNPNTFVVVHLYQPHIKECVWLNKCLDHVAAAHDNVLFLRILSTEAKKDYDEIALPTLLIYKKGAVVHCYVRVTEELGEHFTATDVSELLSLHGVVPWVKPGNALDERRIRF